MYDVEEKLDFFWMLADEQMEFLKSEYNSVANSSDEARGAKVAEMREYMNLGGLFKEDKNFMNGDLRDFLNLKEDGAINYKHSELTKENGWTELCTKFDAQSFS